MVPEQAGSSQVLQLAPKVGLRETQFSAMADKVLGGFASREVGVPQCSGVSKTFWWGQREAFEPGMLPSAARPWVQHSWCLPWEKRQEDVVPCKG